MNSNKKSLFFFFSLIFLFSLFISINYTYAKDENNFYTDNNSSKFLAATSGLWGTIKGLFSSTPQVLSVRQAGRMVLYGTNFTSGDNAVKFISNDTGKEYEVLEIPSSDGVSIAFNVPVDVIPGTYTVKAGAFNSDWSNTLTFNVLGAQAPTLSFTATPSAVLLGQSSTISWISSGASSCAGESELDKLPTEWKSPGLTGSFSFTPSENASFTLTCTGPGGNVTKTVSISVGNFAGPIVSLNATSKNITEGQGTTLSWSTARVSSCYGSGTGDSATLSKWNKRQPITGSLYITPSQNSSLSLVCAGNGSSATATSTITINVVQPPPVPEITASCTRVPNSPTSTYDTAIKYTANPSGGNGTYTYLWNGTDGLSGNSQSVTFNYYNPLGQRTTTKTANVKISSGDKNITIQCPSIIINDSLGRATGSIPPYIASISPSSGPTGTVITLSTGPISGASGSFDIKQHSVFIRNGNNTIYAQPSLTNTGYCTPGIIATQCSTLTFTLPQILSAINGTVYSVGVFTHGGGSSFESNAINFTLGSIPTPIPNITSITPNSGNINTSVILKGSNFSADTTVQISQASETYSIRPTYAPASYPNPATLTFNFFPTSGKSGPYAVKANNKGVFGNAVLFQMTASTPTLQLSAIPSTINIGSGQQIVVNWSATNVSSCKGDTSNFNPSPIWRNPGSSGSFSFSPSDSTVLTLTCVGDGGSVTKNVSINVIPLATAPSIDPFTSSLYPGTITIRGREFDTTGPNSVRFVKISGSDFERWSDVTTNNANYLSVTFSDLRPGTYQVTVSNKNGISASATLVIEATPEQVITPPVVIPTIPVPSLYLRLSQLIVTSTSQPITVSWSSVNATSCIFSTDNKGDYWSGIVGQVETSGSLTGTSDSNTSFTVSCTGAGGSTTRTGSVEVRITDPATPPTVTLTADPLIVPPSEKDGEPVTITWSSTNASACTLNAIGGEKSSDGWGGYLGPIDLSGSFTGNTAFDTAFTVTCTGAGGTASKTVSVTVGTGSMLQRLNMAQILQSLEWNPFIFIRNIFK
ncbi:MAG: hypothetical protein WCW03_00600 [Candidatus Paceibacterota bacterium]